MKRIIALILVLLFAVCAAEEKVTIPSETYYFFVRSAELGEDLIFTEKPTIAMGIRMFDGSGDGFRTVFANGSYAMFMTKAGTYKYWPFVALIETVCEISEQEAAKAWSREKVLCG